jgi:sigma-E factor negative regulatory protein RseA
MTDERHSEHPGERHERDSQLSAMFDGELPAAECELLARRLTRDDALRAQWSRYSIIGAALRAERGVALHDRVAWRVQSVIAQETTYGEGGADSIARTAAAAPSTAGSSRRWQRLAWPTAGASIAAGVAAVSILWLRGVQEPVELLQADAAVTETIVLTPETSGTTVAMSSAPTPEQPPSNGEPERYSTPAPSTSTTIVPPARLANYVVAHSEYSGPLSRRMALLGIVGAEAGDGVAAPESAQSPNDGEADNNAN